MRPSGRVSDKMRPVSLEPGVAKYAEGSCLAKFGDTHVLCTATVEERVQVLEDREAIRGLIMAYGYLCDARRWDELLEIGSWSKARDVGKLRVEGKDYEVADGDVMEIRFNV